MKYLNAWLQEPEFSSSPQEKEPTKPTKLLPDHVEISIHPKGNDPTKPTKPVSWVLWGVPPRDTEISLIDSERSSRPSLNTRGELIIPPNCLSHYRWWAGGQSIAAILAELNAPPEVWRRYIPGYTETSCKESETECL